MTSISRPSTWMAQIGLWALGASLATLGILGIATADFAFQWQPVATWFPARSALAIAFGLLEVVAGALLLPTGTRRLGGIIAAVALVAWTALHVPALADHPDSMADWLGLAEPAAITAALALTVATSSARAGAIGFERGCTIAFGLSALVFGASHLVYAEFTASMVPPWLPQRVLLAYLTGACHMLAGAAVTLNILGRLAAGWEAVMMLSFVVLVHVPRIVRQPDSRMEWTMMLVATMLAVSAWLIRHFSRKTSVRNPVLIDSV